MASLLFAVSYAAARSGYAEFYRPFGLAPETVGLTELQVVSQAGTIFSVLLALVASMVAVGLLNYHVSRAAQIPIDRDTLGDLTDLGWKGYLPSVIVILGPVVVVGVLLAFSAGRTGARWILAGGLASIGALWLVAALAADAPRPRKVQLWVYIFTVLLTLPLVGSWTSGDISVQLKGTYVVVLLLAGPVAAVAYESAHWRRVRSFLLPFLLPLALIVMAAVTGGFVSVWMQGAVSAAVLGALLGSAADPGSGRALRRTVPRIFPGGLPRLGPLLVIAVITAGTVTGAFALWELAARDARSVLRNGVPRGIFSDHVFPARVALRGDETDPLGVCRSERVVTLLGRGDGLTYVLLRPTMDGPAKPVVVGLSSDDYTVLTGDPVPGACVRLAGSGP